MSNGHAANGSPLRKVANGDVPKGRGKRVDLAALEHEDTGATLTGNLILSAGNPRSSLSKDGGQTLMHGSFKRPKPIHDLGNILAKNQGPGQQSLLPAGMQKAPPATVLSWFAYDNMMPRRRVGAWPNTHRV